MNCLTPGCGHPLGAHLNYDQAGDKACRVTGCRCTRYEAAPVEDVPEATAITFSIQPGQRARITIEVEVPDAASAGPSEEAPDA